ncbi:Pirin-1 [Cardamine amara subsp. amara]|uniref:Pirin-1 n=1 Tax=Cardamine amara subsp. amara TaxID=228776 RepID=A0ABD0Z4V8_CARAN
MSLSSDSTSVPRQVIKKVLAKLEKEGQGTVVRKGISELDQELLDPFVLLVDFSFSLAAGFPNHPHRGFESVTYMLQGGIIHKDPKGHQGTIQAGDVQWMTAGRGIIHSEFPEEEVNNGLQLWINLPSIDKMIEPKYKELSSLEILRAEEDGVEVKVIAGDSMGMKSPVYTRTPTMFLDFTLKPGSQTHQTVPESWTAFAYIIEGNEGVFGSLNSPAVSAHHVVVFGPGDLVSVWNKSTSRSLRFLLIAGKPIGEPVVQCGPFVMNTQAEIDTAFEDYQNAKNGFEMAKC